MSNAKNSGPESSIDKPYKPDEIGPKRETKKSRDFLVRRMEDLSKKVARVDRHLRELAERVEKTEKEQFDQDKLLKD